MVEESASGAEFSQDLGVIKPFLLAPAIGNALFTVPGLKRPAVQVSAPPAP